MTAAATASRRRAETSTTERLPAAALGVVVAPVLAANGGYSPTSWGWTTAVLGGAVVVAALFRAIARPSALELLFLGALLSFAIWETIAMAWTQDVSQTPLEAERTLVYVAAALAAASIVRRREVADLLGGVLAGAAVICGYSLMTRLLPDSFAQPTFSSERLYRPVGYWNSLGLVAAMATLLAVTIVARSRSAAGRTLAGAAVPIAVCTLYFTFSRGAGLALGLGAVVLVALDRRRLQLLAFAAPPVALGAVAVGAAATKIGGTAPAPIGPAHFVAAVVVVASAGAGWAVYMLRKVERTTKLRSRHRRLIGWALVAGATLALIGLFATAGSPWAITERAYHSISSNPPDTHGDLNKRLLSLSNNGRLAQWRVAVTAFEAHPLLGTGPGSYEELWFQHRPGNWKVKDAHNLYVETLAESGLVGMLLLGLALVAPVVAFVRVRREPLAAGALAVWIAYLAHAAVDWDWELSGVTLVALLSGGALLALARRDEERRPARTPLLALAAVISAAALYGLAGNLAIAASRNDTVAGNSAAGAAEARRAKALAPWSAEPWWLLGQAQLGLGQRAQAQASLDTAVSKSSRDWELWLDVARASTGRRRARAIAKARRLNPLDPTVRVIARELSASRG